MDDGGAHLGLDVVADDGGAGFAEAALPVVAFAACDKDGDAVYKAAARRQYLLYIPLGSLLGADGQVVYDNIHFALFEYAHDVVGWARSLLDDVGHIASHAVVRHSALDGNAGVGDVLELDGVVGLGEDGFGQVLPNFAGVDVEGGDEVDVAHAVFA